MNGFYYCILVSTLFKNAPHKKRSCHTYDANRQFDLPEGGKVSVLHVRHVPDNNSMLSAAKVQCEIITFKLFFFCFRFCSYPLILLCIRYQLSRNETPLLREKQFLD